MRTSVATVGYRFNQNFAVEGGYVDLGKASYSANFTGGNANGPGSSASSTNWKPNFGIGGTYVSNTSGSASSAIPIPRAKSTWT